MSRASSFLLLFLLAACLASAGCAGSSSDSSATPSWMQGITADPGEHSDVPIPNQVSGGNPNDPALRSRRSAQTAPTLTPAQQEAVLASRRTQADALWRQAEATRSPSTRASLFKRIGDNYPEVPRAAEARFEEGKARVAEREYLRANEVLVEYMTIAPVNPHTAEVEELIYQSSIRDLKERRGLLAIFRTDENALKGLEYVTRAFPAGNYGDDALLELARYHRGDGDPGTASLNYKELLRRFPDSEWSFTARLELADTYFMRDPGNPYAAGFVQQDPRERIPDDPVAKANAGPVKSALELAIEQYELFVERIALDPARQGEYAAKVAYAENQIRLARQRLAGKDQQVAAWYAARGDRAAADAYRRSAERWLQPGASQDSAVQASIASAGPVQPAPHTPPSPPPVGPTPVAPKPVTPTPVTPTQRGPSVPPPPSNVLPPPQRSTLPPPPAPRPGTTVPGVPPPGYTAPRTIAVPPPPPPPAWPAGR